MHISYIMLMGNATNPETDLHNMYVYISFIILLYLATYSIKVAK